MIWCFICTTVGVHYQERPSVLYMYDCRSPLPGASICCYICTTVGAHYQERPSGAIYVRL